MITDVRVVDVARELIAADPSRPVTPGRLFKALGVVPQCGTCFATIRTVMIEEGLPFICPEPVTVPAHVDGEPPAPEPLKPEPA